MVICYTPACFTTTHARRASSFRLPLRVFSRFPAPPGHLSHGRLVRPVAPRGTRKQGDLLAASDSPSTTRNSISPSSTTLHDHLLLARLHVTTVPDQLTAGRTSAE